MRKSFHSALGNLGFILQVNGIILIVPIGVALLYGESDATISLSLAAIVSLIVGFLLASLFKRVKMTFESASILMPLTYIFLGLIGTIPYLYLGESVFPRQDAGNVVVNGFFESVSGFTTTGLTLIKDVESLPRSLVFFRGLSQWLGGISIVYLMLMFLTEPGETSRILGEISGFEKIRTSIRGTFLEVVKIYLLYTLLFTALLFFLGGIDLFNAVNIVFTGISTAGFVPVNDIGALMNPISRTIVTVLMIVGATSFMIHYNLFRKRLKGSSVEFQVFLFFLALCSLIAYSLLSTISLTDIWVSLFHVVSASTTTGFQLLNLGGFPRSMKMLLILLMFVGGCSFSTAGGIKIVRLLVASKTVSWTVRRASLPYEAVTPLRIGDRTLLERDLVQIFVLIFLGVASLFISSLIFAVFGYPLLDSVFELTSAFATTGLSTGLTSLTLPPLLKLILVVEMIMGRTEVIPFLILIRGGGR